MVSVPAQIENGHFQNTRKMCHCFASVHILACVEGTNKIVVVEGNPVSFFLCHVFAVCVLTIQTLYNGPLCGR